MDGRTVAVVYRRQIITASSHHGFTLVELLIGLALSCVVTGITIFVFVSQQDSYRAQIRISALQQNLRAAMNIISRDIMMAGHCTSSDRAIYRDYLDWDPRKKGPDNFSPRIHGINNMTGVQKYRPHTDVLVIVKAGEDRGKLDASEYAASSGKTLFLNDLDLDDDGDEDFNTSGRKFGLVMKSDFSLSQLFKIIQKGPPVKVTESFRATYREGDTIARADILIYRIDDGNASFGQPVLERKNVGNGNQFQVVAEGITDLQLRYFLYDDRIVEDPGEEEGNIYAVEVSLSGEVEIGRAEKRSRSLVTILKIRNV